MSPGKSYLARPVSPLKPAAPAPAGGAAGILTNMVEKAKSTRPTGGRKAAEPASTVTVGAGRGKRAAAPTAAPKVGRGRASTISDSSDTSSGTTVVRKPAAAKNAAPAKKGVMSTIKGMGGTGATKKLPAAKPAAATTGTRVLRKRT